eukprot:3740366-Lingulodinium_polyedra.AAC.1
MMPMGVKLTKAVLQKASEQSKLEMTMERVRHHLQTVSKGLRFDEFGTLLALDADFANVAVWCDVGDTDK